MQIMTKIPSMESLHNPSLDTFWTLTAMLESTVASEFEIIPTLDAGKEDLAPSLPLHADVLTAMSEAVWGGAGFRSAG